jgi:UDP-glucose-4-epimerase GalE
MWSTIDRTEFRHMKILVTGGAGYVGSHACKALARDGYEPIVYDNLSRGHRWAVKWGTLEEGDISDTLRITEVLKRYQPAALMHFAAFTSVGESIEHPELYHSNNVAGSIALLRTAADHSAIPVIFSSSAAVYGLPNSVPIAEDQPPTPINPYGQSKLAIEDFLKKLDQTHHLRSVSLRYFNAAGADDQGEIGECHNPETHLVPLVLAAAQSNSTINVFGNDYPTPDGTCVRDYIHVMDIAEAHVNALKYLLDGGRSLVCNLANNRGYSVNEVIKTAERVCGVSIRSEVVSRRAGDPPILIGLTDRARKFLGWIPRRSNLETQILDAWKWMKAAPRI